MLWERLIAERRFKDYPAGHTEPTGELITETGAVGDDDTVEDEGEVATLPTTLTLRCRMAGLPILPFVNTTVELIINERSVGRRPLYDQATISERSRDIAMRQCVAGVQILYTGMGSVRMADDPVNYSFRGENVGAFRLTTGALVHEKRFTLHDMGPIVERHVHHGAEVMISPPDQPNVHPLYAFGGYYAPGATCDEIAPVYANLVEGAGTAVTLHTTASWNSRHIFFPEGGFLGATHVLLMTPMDRMQASPLAVDIREGKLKITLKTPHAGGEEGGLLKFRSHTYAHLSGQAQLVDITFVREDL